ncbi:MarR family winged helix-turn-helix transcriptional regulator [Paenibacillus piri]|uniref:MarR family transcriptional regulator n=1 Tax=Paenibacillus piri TaxID=2547395 RepID=A0A4V2ZSM8_9BACL|nr:MarR family transcriptional regulator [Paenibacillus piri]TDF93824.1 MarR family transcriptional regulator [Paenibacillus piri]
MMKQEPNLDIIMDTFKASNLLSRWGGKLASKCELTSVQQWLILGAIAQPGKTSLGDLTKDTMVTKQNITKMVERMKASGLVLTYQKPGDKRYVYVELTKLGYARLEQLEEMRTEMDGKLLSAFTEEELGTFSRLLNKLIDELK